MSEIIGFVGGMCSGKDSWASYFARMHGFTTVTTSNVARQYIADHGLGEPTRDLTRETATRLRGWYGSDYLARTAVGQCDGFNKIAVSGLYVPDEVDYLKGRSALIVRINATPELQVARMQIRDREGESGGIKEFMRLAGNDLHSADTDQRLEEVLDMADMEIDGAVTFDDEAGVRAISDEVLTALGDLNRGRNV